MLQVTIEEDPLSDLRFLILFGMGLAMPVMILYLDSNLLLQLPGFESLETRADKNPIV